MKDKISEKNDILAEINMTTKDLLIFILVLGKLPLPFANEMHK